MKNIIIMMPFILLNVCQANLESEYTGGITQETLIGSTWQEINTDFNGTYIRWYFKSSTQIIQSQRGGALYYSWEPYTIIGTVAPNPQNQAVFKLLSGSPGGELAQYLLIWFINAAGTKAIFKYYTTPEDITRFLVNSTGAVNQINYQKILP